MRPSAYLETTVFGYLALRSSRDLRVAANQVSSQEWWDLHRAGFDLFVSQFVIKECQQGDPSAADERRFFWEGIPVLDMNTDAESLAVQLAKGLQLPAKAEMDAFHISIAAVHGIQYLLTYNCTHIANPEYRKIIDRLCRTSGFEPPVICTPFDLLRI